MSFVSKVCSIMEACKVINKVPTKILTFGKGVGEDLLDVKHLVVVFPGNPGVIEFYREFMNDLYMRLQHKYPKMHIPVWGISHAGHQRDEIHEHSHTFPFTNENPEFYSLEGQYTHKVKFLESFVPAHIKIIGIGHSIGCKTWLETMKRLDDQICSISEPKKTPKIEKVFMLFPTIERMRHTPNGQGVQPYLRYFRLLIPLLWLVNLVPFFIKKWGVRWYYRKRNPPPCAFAATMELLDYEVLKRIIFMAKCELEQVDELDEVAVGKYLDKMDLYFGTTDGWCPLFFAAEMKERFPKLKCKICENGYDHAFVLESSQGAGIASHIADLIVIENK